jgi:hypothetical protein
VNNSLGGSGPPLPAGVGVDQPGQPGALSGVLGGPSIPLVQGQPSPYPVTPLQPPIPQYPGGYGPPQVPIPHVSSYDTSTCPPGYYRSGGICVPIEQATGGGVLIGAKGAIQQVQIDPQTFPGQFFLIKILVINTGSAPAKFSAKVTIPALNITALPTAGAALDPGQSVVIHKQIMMTETAPPGQLLPATIELIRTDATAQAKIDDTEQSTIPSPGAAIPPP